MNKLWLVPSASLKKNENMKDLAKEVLKLRKNLDYQSFDHYLKIRQKIYILEKVEFENGTKDFFCNCFLGSKSKMCKHTVAMLMKTGMVLIDEADL